MTKFATPPSIEKNPNERAPLVAIVRFRPSCSFVTVGSS